MRCRNFLNGSIGQGSIQIVGQCCSQFNTKVTTRKFKVDDFLALYCVEKLDRETPNKISTSQKCYIFDYLYLVYGQSTLEIAIF